VVALGRIEGFLIGIEAAISAVRCGSVMAVGAMVYIGELLFRLL
jgi:hypothetical protein